MALADGSRFRCRKLLLAAGLVDELPPVEGARELFGRGVFHCPYCDGWEVRGGPLAAYGAGERGLDLALELTGWSDDIVLCSDGPARLPAPDRDRLGRLGIAVEERRIARFEGDGGRLRRIHFAGGGALARRALFFPPVWQQRSDLAARLGAPPDARGLTPAAEDGATAVPGLYVAGDTAGRLQLAVVAAAEGARAAVSINAELLKEDLAARVTNDAALASRH